MRLIEFHEDCLFEGIITHSRIHPFNHRFNYEVTYFWFDIENFNEKLFFKKNKFSLFSFNENDHGLKKRNESLQMSIIKNLRELKNYNIENIKVLCLPSIMGYSFNPISIFVCFDKSKRAKIVIFEVNNTFNERHLYYCKVLKKNPIFVFNKKLYVSPFFKVRGFYRIKFKMLNNKIFLNIDYEIDKKKVFSATFSGIGLKISSKNLIRVFLRKMFQNIKITFGIYFQALKLYLKGAKYIKRPSKPDKEFTLIK